VGIWLERLGDWVNGWGGWLSRGQVEEVGEWGTG